MKQAAVKKEGNFPDWQELAKFEDALQLVEVRNLVEKHVSLLYRQRLKIMWMHQNEEVTIVVKNSSHVQLQQASEITMIVHAVYNESQIIIDVRGSNDMQEINYELMPKLNTTY